MPSIKKVAEVAGVSVGTVSHVITGSVRVSEELRLRVPTAIRQLKYHPNHMARSLKTNRTLTLGIIVPDLTIPFFPQVIRGADEAARKSAYAGFATFDELTVDDLFTPSITTVVQPAYHIGFRAAEILLSRIKGTAGDQTITPRLPAHLKVGASSAHC